MLNEIKPPPIAVTCAMDILIRLARHSHITALNIANTPYFLESIVENFMPLSTDKIGMQYPRFQKTYFINIYSYFSISKNFKQRLRGSSHQCD